MTYYAFIKVFLKTISDREILMITQYVNKIRKHMAFLKISRKNTGERNEKKELIEVPVLGKFLFGRILEINQSYLPRPP